MSLFNGSNTVFQTDAGPVYVTVVAEMLLRSREGQTNLLPALPQAWASGLIKGLCACGYFEVETSWENKKLKIAQKSDMGRSSLNWSFKKREALILDENLTIRKQGL